MLHTRSCLLTLRQQHQILDLFASDCHVALDAYRAPNASAGKALMQADINTLSSTRVPRSLTELMTLGRTLKRRAGEILAYFGHPHTTGGPTEAINGRLEHLRCSALGLAKPHPLHHPSTPRNRRIQTPTTPPIMKSQIERLNEQIRAYKAHILALGESVYLDEDTYNHTLEVRGTVQRLEVQIKTHDDKNILKKEKDQLIETLHTKMIGLIAADFNDEMNRVNAELYPDGGRKVCPKLQFQINGQGISYKFDHYGDRGSGAKSRHPAIFDVAMLRHTPLPFLIHDSAIIKLVGHAPVRALLGAYMRAAEQTSGAGEPKQIFFSFDATKAYGPQAEELVKTTRVIHLGDGPEALYGFTWNTETTEEGN